MPGPAPAPVRLTDLERDTLLRITRRSTAPQGLARRARLVLLMHEGHGNTHSARKVGVSDATAEMWRKRFNDAYDARRALDDTPEALAARVERDLSDAPRSGAPIQFTAEQVAQILALSLRSPEEFERPVTHWTPQELADEATKQGIVDSISARTVGRFLK